MSSLSQFIGSTTSKAGVVRLTDSVSSTSTTTAATAAAVKVAYDAAVSAGSAFPVGGIIMWSGAITLIPVGWALCNGSNGTPDLRSRFVVGATSDGSTGVTFNPVSGAVSGSYAPGNAGGEVAHRLTIAEMPTHNHSTSVDGSALFPATGATTIAYGGAGGYPATIFSMNTTGSSNYHENRPPYYALAFIMKVS